MLIKRGPYQSVSGVSNIELFYDLIFVHCISTLTSLCHVEAGFIDLGTWALFSFAYLVVLQIWIYTTLLLNRFGDRSAQDNICLFTNMFLLYYLASGIHSDWASTRQTFSLAWAGILVNLAVHWAVKRWRYTNLSDDDQQLMRSSMVMLSVQALGALVAAFLPLRASVAVSWVTLLAGTLAYRILPVFRSTKARFAHLTERCGLLVIIAFGETIVAISPFMTSAPSMLYPVLIFVLVVGLFLIFMYEHDTMIDHHLETDGNDYQAILGWIIFIIGNLTVAFEYMAEREVAFMPKNVYFITFLVLYLLTSFTLGRYHRPEFGWTGEFAVGRIIACIVIVLVAILTGFDPLASLICDTIIVYIALGHEWLLYQDGTKAAPSSEE